jgi:hypothetical protein
MESAILSESIKFIPFCTIRCVLYGPPINISLIQMLLYSKKTIVISRNFIIIQIQL